MSTNSTRYLSGTHLIPITTFQLNLVSYGNIFVSECDVFQTAIFCMLGHWILSSFLLLKVRRFPTCIIGDEEEGVDRDHQHHCFAMDENQQEMSLHHQGSTKSVQLHVRSFTGARVDEVNEEPIDDYEVIGEDAQKFQLW